MSSPVVLLLYNYFAIPLGTINYIIFDLQCHLLYTEFVEEHRLPLPPDNKILPDTKNKIMYY